MPEKFLTMRQAEERLGVSSRTIFNFIQRGEIKGFKIGKSWRFSEEEIEGYIERQRQKQGKPEKSVA